MLWTKVASGLEGLSVSHLADCRTGKTFIVIRAQDQYLMVQSGSECYQVQNPWETSNVYDKCYTR